MWELMSSLRLFRDPATAALHLPWAEEVRDRLADLDLLPLLALVPPEGYIPDFLTQPPTSPLVRFEDELERVRSTPARQVVKELEIFRSQHEGGLPAPAEKIARNPRREVARLADTLADYWRRAVEPFWPRILTLLSADLRHRAMRLTEGGPAALFADLHPTVAFDGDWLHVDQAWQGVVELGGRGLLLVPTAFSWQRPSVIAIRPWQPTLIYPARGVGLLWEPEAESPPELAALMGETRARLLGTLNAPRTTTELARLLEITPGGVSQHLSALAAARLVSRRREGRAVLYARTTLGDALVSGPRPANGELGA
jgi:DNA-binding transcriptional ArsR family regulator